MTIKDLKYVKINSGNPLYLIFCKVNGYLKEINGNESKEKVKKHEERWSKIRDLIRSITKNSDDYDEKYILKSNSIRMTSCL